jgi:hypothetical protein
VKIVDAQRRVRNLPPGVRFGFATSADQARWPCWRDALLAETPRENALPAEADLLRHASHHLSPLLGGVASLPFLHDTTTKNVIVDAAGQLSGIVDVDDLCWGDGRYVIALTRVALATLGCEGDYIRYWLSAADERHDALFDLYIAIPAYGLLGESLRGLSENGNQHFPGVHGVVGARPRGLYMKCRPFLDCSVDLAVGSSFRG